MPKTAHNLTAADLDALHAARETLARYATMIGEALATLYGPPEFGAQSLGNVTSAMETLINEPLQ